MACVHIADSEIRTHDVASQEDFSEENRSWDDSGLAAASSIVFALLFTSPFLANCVSKTLIPAPLDSYLDPYKTLMSFPRLLSRLL